MHAPRKSLGQHFLRDARIVRRILDAARLRPGQQVLEVGPGPGVLTRPLVEAVHPGRVVAVEADRRFADDLEAEGLPGLQVVHGDALRTDLASFGRFHRIVANLPYQISGPVTAAFLDLLGDAATRWDLAVLMYQKEFADRLRAGPGDSAYGRLSVHVARWCRVAKVRDVSPACFDPPPKVHSTVLQLVPHSEAPFAVPDEEAWTTVVDCTFQQRRKQLRNTLPGAVAGLGVDRDEAVAVLEGLGWATARPEALGPADFAALAARLAELR